MLPEHPRLQIPRVNKVRALQFFPAPAPLPWSPARKRFLPSPCFLASFSCTGRGSVAAARGTCCACGPTRQFLSSASVIRHAVDLSPSPPPLPRRFNTNMSSGSFMGDRPSTRVRAPPGGASSISLGWSDPAPAKAPAPVAAPAPAAAYYAPPPAEYAAPAAAYHAPPAAAYAPARTFE